MNVCCPTQTCCGYAPLVTSDQILGTFDSSPALVRCILNNDPITDIMQLLLWPPEIQTKLLKGTTRGWGPLSGMFMWGIPTSGFIMAVALKLLSHWGYGPPVALVPATAIVQYQAKVCYHLFYFSKQWANPHPFARCWLHDPLVYMVTRVNNNAAMERGQVESHIKV